MTARLALASPTAPDGDSLPWDLEASDVTVWAIEPGCRPPTGEERLCAAILVGAIHDLHRTGRHGHEWAQVVTAEAAAWFGADDDAWPFSFVRICETLR